MTTTNLKHDKAKRGGVLRWFMQVGWKHLVGLFVIAFSTLPLLYILSTALTETGNIENYVLFRQFYLGNFYDLLTSTDYPFVIWMKNTLIPLDMIFADPSGSITHIHENAIPNDLTTIDGGANVQFVLEINGGLARRMGIGLGDQLAHPSIAGSACGAP